jgi:hypothetical protein
LAPASFPTLERMMALFTVAQLCVVTSALAQTNAPALNSGPRDGLAHDVMDRGLVTCTAVDAHDATTRIPRGISNDWSTSLSKEALE